ncbi:MAG: hypothetical protein P3B98_00220 [Gemmatimonadota bacterium]|nr:hypothetical protein [Gemmatimonadota bacterium]
MSHGRFIPPDYTRGDEGTVGGYAAVHGRAAALEGKDGLSYSLEVLTDETGDLARPYGAYLVFLQWRRMGEQGIAGHLETDFLAYGQGAHEALAQVAATPLADCQRLLDALVAARDGDSGRRWFDVMREEGE